MSYVLSLIVACDPNGVIGLENRLPWPRLEGDLKRFKALTTGKVVIMGRNTYDSLPKPLVDRTMVVLTRIKDVFVKRLIAESRFPYEHEFHVVDSKEEAEAVAKNLSPVGEIMIIGGAEIYRLYLPEVERLYITLTSDCYSGDVIVPELKEIISKLNTDDSEWIVESKDDVGTHAYYVLVRKV